MTCSVLIAAWQAASTLPRTLESLRGQTWTDWELVVIEDGSDDGTRDVVAAFAASASQPVRYERNPANLGVAATRTRLLAAARGEWVAFLDADDRWLPSHLADLHACLEAGHTLAISGITWWDAERDAAEFDYVPGARHLAQPRRSLFDHSFIQTSSSVAFRRAEFARVGPFAEDLRIGEDRDYWFRMLEGGRTVGCTDRATCRYLKHAAGAMTRTRRVAADTVRFYERHRQSPDIPAAHARERLSRALRDHGRLERAHDPAAARRAFLRAWRLRPWSFDLPFRALFAGF